MTWDDLTTPRELIEELARQNGVEVTGLELVPHDLWAAADLPPLPWADRLTLIAIQFDLTFTVSADGATVRLVPLPDRVAIVRSYPGGTNPAATARKYAALAPGAEVKASAGRVYVRGLVEDQERITHPRRAVRRNRPPARTGLTATAEGGRAAGRAVAGEACQAVETGVADRPEGDPTGRHFAGPARCRSA